MKKILKSILIILMIFVLISPACYAKKDDEDKLDLKEQVKKEEGSLFEKIIAECIGGLAQTVVDFTTR